jgi:hypothetical protein
MSKSKTFSSNLPGVPTIQTASDARPALDWIRAQAGTRKVSTDTDKLLRALERLDSDWADIGALMECQELTVETDDVLTVLNNWEAALHQAFEAAVLL